MTRNASAAARSCLAGLLLLCGLALAVAAAPSASSQGNGGGASVHARLAALEAANAELAAANAALGVKVAALEAKTAYLSVAGTDTYFTGTNVHVRSGQGATNGRPDAPLDPAAGESNGLGNLIVGYNETDGFYGDERGGSHNLVVGIGHDYTAYGGLAAGARGRVSAPFGSVSGGNGNTASGRYGSVSGGQFNTALQVISSVSGGVGNTASGRPLVAPCPLRTWTLVPVKYVSAPATLRYAVLASSAATFIPRAAFAAESSALAASSAARRAWTEAPPPLPWDNADGAATTASARPQRSASPARQDRAAEALRVTAGLFPAPRRRLKGSLPGA
ncbi:MAG TPA: hypothetical protein VM490_23570 [Armatimonadaceae bacterium]|nr:hypothetical protein [Armatimonadaceae bacterium]